MVARLVHPQQPLKPGKHCKPVGRNRLLGFRERLGEFVCDIRGNAGMPQGFVAPDFVSRAEDDGPASVLVRRSARPPVSPCVQPAIA